MGTLANDLMATDNINTLPASEYTEMIKRGIRLAHNQMDDSGFTPAAGKTNEKYDVHDWLALAKNLTRKSDLNQEDVQALRTATQYAVATSSDVVNKQLNKFLNETTHHNLENLIENTKKVYSNNDISKATALLYIAEKIMHNENLLKQEYWQENVRDHVKELN